MDIKEYIDDFPEIADRERHEQFELLEQARDTSFTPPAKRLFQMYCWLLPVFMIIGLGGVLYSVFGYGSWLPLVAIVIGLIISRQMISQRRKALMQRGLQQVLATSKAG
ncbi:MAG: MerC domain-containing protein [Alteromonadaceae bacterium]|nr:MerC domain-containing protein [Alteromonadaceae bacterium]